MKYVNVYRENQNFEDYCSLCKTNVVNENLQENGGTLQIPNAVYYSDLLIIAMKDNRVVGFIALNTSSRYSVYINQIAIKNDHKRQGIGTALVTQTVDYAKDKDITCDIRSYNIASQELFKSCGFIKDENCSSERYYFYKNKNSAKRKRKYYGTG